MGTGAATPNWRNRLLLAVRALEVGDWATALALPPSDPREVSEEAAYLSSLVRVTADGLARLATGDVADAERLLFEAAVLLPDRLVGTDRDGRRLALLVTGQHITRDPDPLTCRVAAVLGREQRALQELRRRLVRCTTARDFLIEAAIQVQCEVECSPFSWIDTADAGLPQPAVTPTRKDLLERATKLRQWVQPRAGKVTEPVWKDLHGHRALWAQSMTRLAARTPATPLHGTATVLPPRRGHQEAVERALRWQENLEY